MKKTGIEDLYIRKYNKNMRLGYTTGTCAAAAAKAAAYMLLNGVPIDEVEIKVPKGLSLVLPLEEVSLTRESAECCIRKDAGDDPDVTNGLLIGAKVVKGGTSISLKGGLGVGRVTRKGLEQPVGSPAINKVPREMIENAVQEVCDQLGYEQGLAIEIFVPRGAEIAKKTFNSRLGIEGGISILGTSGIVEPMSDAALMETIRMEIKMKVANGYDILLISPGNYGMDFSKDFLKISDSIKCSNFVGVAVDACVEYGVKKVLFVAHIGKFVKVSGGIMNTHSREADCRAELITSHAIRAGASGELAQQLLETQLTDEAIALLEEKKLVEGTMTSMMEKIAYYLSNRGSDDLEIGVILFSNQWGKLGATENAATIVRELNEQGEMLNEG